MTKRKTYKFFCYQLVIFMNKFAFIKQRRRSAEDEQMMRKHLQEGDLISAEVQSVFSDGSLSLHTRSLKYGKVIFSRLLYFRNLFLICTSCPYFISTYKFFNSKL